MDLRNEFLKEVKLAVMEYKDSEIIVAKISRLLERYELSERITDLVPSGDTNLDILKAYTGSLLVDGRSKKTIKAYLGELKRFLKVINKSLKEVSAYDIRNYLAKKKLDGVCDTTLENSRAMISAFYMWLEAEEIIDKNPCKNIKPIKHNKKIKPPFTNTDIDKIRFACKTPKVRAIVETLLASGVRVSELCNLNVEDIDFDTGRVKVLHGKGNKDRTTYLNNLAKSHLKTYLEGRTSGALFLSQRKERYTVGGIREMLRQISKASGVSDVHPHRFRRTFATTLAERGMQIQEIQKLMGHSNINTTMLYVTLSDIGTKYAYMKYA